MNIQPRIEWLTPESLDRPYYYEVSKRIPSRRIILGRDLATGRNFLVLRWYNRDGNGRIETTEFGLTKEAWDTLKELDLELQVKETRIRGEAQ